MVYRAVPGVGVERDKVQFDAMRLIIYRITRFSGKARKKKKILNNR